MSSRLPPVTVWKSSRRRVGVCSPGQTGKVIHRVVAVHPRGIITKGDNVAAADDWLLAPKDILGKVVSINRRAAFYPCPGGAGQLYLLKAQTGATALFPTAPPVYQRLVHSACSKVAWRLG